MNKQKILIICSVVIIIASIATSIYIISSKDKEAPNPTIEGILLPDNKDVLNDAIIGNLKITNVSLLTRDGMSVYKAEVSNETEKSIKIKNLYVIFYENDNATKTLALSNVTLFPNKKTNINITSETDLSKITKIEYVSE